MKTAVVTGGAGFLGSHLCERLLKEGLRVIAIDNFCTGREENLVELSKNDLFSFFRQDVSQYILIPENVDYVLHFASPASPIDYLKMPIQTLKVGALGTHNALGLAKDKKARFLLASTSEVYGDPKEHPQKETYWGNVNPVGPRGVYDEAKRFAEAITMAYYNTHKVNTGIVRIFNTYGPRMRLDDGRALPTFMRQAILNEPITIFGDGNQTRSFCYYTDLIEGIIRLLFSEEHFPVNIGNDFEISLNDFVREVILCTNSSSVIDYLDLPKDDPKRRKPDLTRAKELLCWGSKIDYKKGLRLTLDYFKSRCGG